MTRFDKNCFYVIFEMFAIFEVEFYFGRVAIFSEYTDCFTVFIGITAVCLFVVKFIEFHFDCLLVGYDNCKREGRVRI